MRKKQIALIFAALLINFLLVVGVTMYYPVHWTILGDDNNASDTDDAWSSQTGTAVKYDFSMHASYRLQVLQSEMSRLAKIDACASVMANPVSFWRSQRSTSTNFTADIDLERLNVADNCTTVPIADFIKTPPVPTQYSFEIPYLEDPPVIDILKVSNYSTSSVVLCEQQNVVLAAIKFIRNTIFEETFMNYLKAATDCSTFFIGDTVALFITVRDGEGNPKTKGGDDIRAWFTDVSSSNSTLPAKITDYGNGTYLATAVLAFVGTFRTNVALAYSREYIQTVVIMQLMIKSPAIYLAAYRNSRASETAVCSHVPVIPGANQSEICNVTEINGTPWFCGRPVKPWLTCTDYVQIRKLRLLLTMPMNQAEKLLMSAPNKMLIIPGSFNITLTVSVREDNKNLTRLTSTKDCSSIPPRLTWEHSEPTGYLYKGLWHSYFCRRPDRATDKCLRNIHIIMLGDSNGRELYEDISSRSSCKQQIIKEYSAWHKPLKCINSNLNFTLEWIPHSNPFRTTDTQWAGVGWIKASNKVIDEVLSTGRYLIHIHHYLHPSGSHISAFVNMMAAIKESLVRLLKRNPNVSVVLQGSHVSWRLGSRITYLMGDTLRRFFTIIISDIFQDLRDHIYYLQTSDITIASTNNETHPQVNWQISNMMTGFICGRQ